MGNGWYCTVLPSQRLVSKVRIALVNLNGRHGDFCNLSVTDLCNHLKEDNTLAMQKSDP